MPSNDNKKPADDKKKPLPSTGEGADSALDVLRKKREQAPPSDPTIPPKPPAKK